MVVKAIITKLIQKNDTTDAVDANHPLPKNIAFEQVPFLVTIPMLIHDLINNT